MTTNGAMIKAIRELSQPEVRGSKQLFADAKTWEKLGFCYAKSKS